MYYSPLQYYYEEYSRSSSRHCLGPLWGTRYIRTISAKRRVRRAQARGQGPTGSSSTTSPHLRPCLHAPSYYWFSCASILSVSLRHFQVNLVELALLLGALVCQVAVLVRSCARLACSAPFDIRLWRPSGSMASTTVTNCPAGSRTSRQRSATLVESGLV